jgi:hypothetical protein
MSGLTTNSAAALTYEGKVTIQLRNGAKVLATKTYHNEGLPYLFKKLHELLAYNVSNQLRFDKETQSTVSNLMLDLSPCYITLYALRSSVANSSSVNDLIQSSWNELTMPETGNPALYVISGNNLIDLKERTDDKVVFQCNVSCRELYASANSVVHALALYPYNIQASPQESVALACYKLTSDNGTQWSPLNVSQASTIHIEWEMAFKNGGNYEQL